MNTADAPLRRERTRVEIVAAFIVVALGGLFLPGLGLVLALVMTFTLLRTEKRSVRIALIVLGAALLLGQIGLIGLGVDIQVGPPQVATPSP